LAGLWLSQGCQPPREPGQSPPSQPSSTGAPSQRLVAAVTTAAPAASAGAAPAAPPRLTSCAAPSTVIRGPRDWRTDAQLADCRFEPSGQEDAASSCGRGAGTPYDPDRLDSAVLAFDEATLSHLRSVARKGRELGRRPRVFGLVGDSLTKSTDFMSAFSAAAEGELELSQDIAQRLRLPAEAAALMSSEPAGPAAGAPPTAATIIDFYRGVKAEYGRDSFRALRAAQAGGGSEWVMPSVTKADVSPTGRMITSLSPAVVLILLGTNDAAARVATPQTLAAVFERRLGRLIDYLERRGVIPVLSTLPRHENDSAKQHCEETEGDLSSWRLALQTNLISATVAAVACRRHLPLIDLRWALEGLINHGIRSDGVHLTVYRHHPGKLDADGLQCGYNVRSYVSLRMLQQVVAAVAAELRASPPKGSRWKKGS